MPFFTLERRSRMSGFQSAPPDSVPSPRTKKRFKLAEEFATAMRAADLDLIFLLAPTSTPERIKQVARFGSGFSYYVSLKGVTGAGNIDTDEVAQKLTAIREHVKLPIGVGFGIRDAATAKAVAKVADAVVIGSRIIQEIEATPKDKVVQAVTTFVSGIRHALDS